MEILVVGSPLTSGEVWKAIITLAYPKANIWWEREESLPNLDLHLLQKVSLVICLFKKTSKEFYALLNNCHLVNAPVLCVVEEDICKEHYEQLFRFGVKGFIGHEMSFETLKKVIHIVKEGGIYIELPYQMRDKKVNAMPTLQQKPKLDETEWRVFSLTSKGNTKEEISQILNVPIEIVTKYQKEILSKTSSKTLSGAVAQGLNRGWLPNF